ncbi:DUF3857 domain-containing protein [Candidatus Fermentibacterales bacterium]|nr:DUF3857 domain-containing protein [Candidatus Fermentibacterales bacterium]
MRAVLTIVLSGLAVASGQDAVFLRHSATVDATQGDGAYVERALEEILLLTGRGVIRFGEMVVGYHDDWEEVTVLRAESHPCRAGRREMDALETRSAHRSLSAASRLESSLREVSLVFQGIEIGDTVIVELERRVSSLPIADAYSYAFFPQGRDSIDSADFTVIWPTGRPLIVSHDPAGSEPSFRSWTTDGGSRTVRSWQWGGSSAAGGSAELGLPLWETLDRVLVSSCTPEQLSLSLARRFQPLVESDLAPEVAAILDSVPPDPDSLRLWVAREVSYLGGEFGQWAGFDARTPLETIREGCGVCRDQAVLLAHLLHHAGFEAGLAFMSSSHRLEELPGIRSFDHAIAFFRQDPGGVMEFLDPSAASSRSGIPWALRGSSCLPATDPGSPIAGIADPLSTDTLRMRFCGVLALDPPRMRYSCVIELHGAAGDLLREMTELAGGADAGEGLLLTLFAPWGSCSLSVASSSPPGVLSVSGAGTMPLRAVAGSDSSLFVLLPGLSDLDLLGSRLCYRIMAGLPVRDGEEARQGMMIDTPMLEVLEIDLAVADSLQPRLMTAVRSQGDANRLHSAETRIDGDTIRLRESCDLTPVRPAPSRWALIRAAAFSSREMSGDLSGRVVVLRP